MLKSIATMFMTNENWRFWGNLSKLLIIILCIVIIAVMIWRRNHNTFCKTCNRRVKKFSKYCDYCGVEMTSTNKEIIIGISKKSKITSALAICVLSVAIIFSIFQTVNNFENASYGTGMYSGYEQLYTDEEDTWGVECKKALSNGSFHQTMKMDNDSNKILSVNSKSSFGTLTLYITQGDKTKQIDISNSNGDLEVDMSAFDSDTKIELKIEHTKVENAQFMISWS